MLREEFIDMLEEASDNHICIYANESWINGEVTKIKQSAFCFLNYEDRSINYLTYDSIKQIKLEPQNVHIVSDGERKKHEIDLYSGYSDVYRDIKDKLSKGVTNKYIDIINRLDYAKNKEHIFDIKNDRVKRAILALKNMVDSDNDDNAVKLLAAVYTELGDLDNAKKYATMELPQKNRKEIKENYVGNIYMFNSEGKFGFIKTSNKDNYYFYISQVNDYRLQDILFNSFIAGMRVKVKFELGLNFRNEVAADNISLLEDQDNITDGKEYTGYITEYQLYNNYGKVLYNSEEYGFIYSAVIGKKLRQDLENNNPSIIKEVLFKLQMYKGKKIATNIMYVDDIIEDKHEKIVSIKYPYQPLKKIETNAKEQKMMHKETDTDGACSILSRAKTSSGKLYNVAHDEMVKGNLELAKKYYLMSLKNENVIVSAVPDLFSVYMRLQEFEEAIRLLDKYESKLTREVYLNLIIQVHHKTKNDDNRLIDLEKEMADRLKVPSKKLHHLYGLAKVYSRCNRYDEAIETLEKWEKIAKNISITSPQKNLLYRAKATIYYKMGNLEEADRIANLILKVNIDDKIANAIINREIEILDSLDELPWDNNWTLSKISPFITDKIANLNLGNEKILVKYLKNGIFSSTRDELVRLLKDIRNRKTSNDGDYSIHNMLCAKLVKQALENASMNDDLEINEQQYQRYLAAALLAMGDEQFISSTGVDQYDFARYCYLQVIRIFKDSETIYGKKVDSYVRFFQTFFYAQSEIKPKRKGQDRYSNEEEVREYIVSSIKVLEKKEIVNNIHMFVVWMVILFADGEGVYMEVLLKEIEKGTLGKDVRNALKYILSSDDLEEHNLYELFRNVVSMYQNVREKFFRNIDELPNAVKEPIKLGNLISVISNHEYNKFMTYQEQKYFFELREQVLLNLIKYDEEYELIQKLEFIEVAEYELGRLIMMIGKNATLMSYEKLVPCLREIHNLIKKEIGNLYSESKPEITIRVDDGCSINLESSTATIPLVLSGKNNTLNAEIKELVIKADTGYPVSQDLYSGMSILGNGDSKSILLKIKVIKDTDLVELHICLKYKYRIYENGEKIYKESEEHKILSAEFYDKKHFSPIVNKFEKCISGQALRDADMFFGREKEIDDIIASMYDGDTCNYGRSIALYGQTRTGKSSILYHLMCKLRKIDLERNIIIDTESIGEIGFDRNINGFLYTIISILRKEIRRLVPKEVKEYYPDRKYAHVELLDILEQYDIELDEERILEAPNDNGQIIFKEQFGNFCEFVTSLEKPYNVILMIDEFTYIYDWIRQGVMQDTFMVFWKALLQNNNIFAFVVGQDHMMQFVKEPRFSNAFQSMDLKKVTYLKENDAKKLMSDPIRNVLEDGTSESRYREGALDRIYELTSGSPYLIMAFCSRLVQYMNEQKAMYITRAHIDDFVRKSIETFEESKFFEPQYNDKSEVDNSRVIELNKTILATIAEISKNKEWANVKDLMKDEKNKAAIEKLVERDVLVRNGANLCKIKVGLYKEWLLKMYAM